MKYKTTYIYKDYDGTKIAEFNTLDEAATALGVTRQTISNMVNGKVSRTLKVQGHILKGVRVIWEEGDLCYPEEPEDLFENLDGEIWRPINGFENYQISNYGRIRKGLKLKTLTPNSDGYIKTSLTNNGEKRTFYVHRLVAEHFLSSWDPSLTVNHIDENKANNHISNLQMMTRADNVKYSYELHKDEWGLRCKKEA